MAIRQWWRNLTGRGRLGKRAFTVKERLQRVERALYGRDDWEWTGYFLYLHPVHEKLAELDEKLELLALHQGLTFQEVQRNFALVPREVDTRDLSLDTRDRPPYPTNLAVDDEDDDWSY